jgi:aryl-phospho-beta-D-glucosidase BglC (GH1 family)
MNLKKKLITLLTSAMCAVSCISISGVNSDKQTVSAAGLTGKNSYEITEQMTIGWNLGNSLECTNDSFNYDTAPKSFVTTWGNPEPTAEMIKTVKAAGFNTIRIPVTWYQHLKYNESTGVYEINQKWMAYVKKVVDWAYNENMFIILNVHHEEWVNAPEFNQQAYAEASAKLRDIWTQVSEQFKDYDQHLIFEGMNEPRETGKGSAVEWGSGDDNSRTYINNLNEIFVNTVRGQGSAPNSERLLMLPGYCASSDINAINAIKIPQNSGNVALSVHAYTPYFFAMDTGEYANHNFPGSDGYGNNYEAQLQSLFSSFKAASDSKGVPMIIGEFSASDFDNTQSRVNWAKYYLTLAKQAGITCVLWDNNVPNNGTGEAHGYLYRLTNTWYPNSIDVIRAMMDTVGVTGYTLPEYKEYEPPKFSWDNVKIGSDWVELFRSDSGEKTDAWDNISVPEMKNYISEDYMFAMVCQSSIEPYVVIQGGWFKVNPDLDLSEDFVLYFTYDEIKKVMEANNITVSEIVNMYLSASGSEATFYGMYAVPVKDTPSLRGDINGDGEVSIVDITLLQKYLLKTAQLEESQFATADLNEDGKINIFDAVILKRIIINGN